VSGGAVTSPLVCLTDWRNVASPTFDHTRKADLWSLYWTATEEGAKDLAGRKIIAWQPGVLYTSATFGAPAGAPYNLALDAMAKRLNAYNGRLLHETVEGPVVRMIDITKRGVVASMAGLRAEHFGGFDGHHLDYFWEGVVPAELQEAWRRALDAFAKILRAQDPDTIIVGQNDRMVGDLWGATNGCYIEQSLYYNGRTPEVHAQDLEGLKNLLKMFDPKRELVNVVEMRDLLRFDQATMDFVRQWCVEHGAYLSAGRNETAKGRDATAGTPL